MLQNFFRNMRSFCQKFKLKVIEKEIHQFILFWKDFTIYVCIIHVYFKMQMMMMYILGQNSLHLFSLLLNLASAMVSQFLYRSLR